MHTNRRIDTMKRTILRLAAGAAAVVLAAGTGAAGYATLATEATPAEGALVTNGVPTATSTELTVGEISTTAA